MADPRREKMEVGRRDGGTERPSLLARQSGSVVRAESSSSWAGERLGDEAQLWLQSMSARE